MPESQWPDDDLRPRIAPMVELVIRLRTPGAADCKTSGCNTSLGLEWNTVGTGMYFEESRICLRTQIFVCPNCGSYPDKPLTEEMVEQIIQTLKAVVEDYEFGIFVSRN